MLVGPLSKSESHYPAHNLEFLALKWVVTVSFQEYLYGNTFTSYSDNIPLTYVLTTTKLDAMGHRWISSLLNSISWFITNWENLTWEANALSSIPWDQSIWAEAVEAIFKDAIKGPDALVEIYACHEKAISSLILQSISVWITIVDWVQAQKVDPTIKQVITWMENKKLETVKVSEGMSLELKRYMRQRGKLHLQEGVLYLCINQARWDHNELQLVVTQEYRLEAMCEANNDRSSQSQTDA